jgi:hypothetical protein
MRHGFAAEKPANLHDTVVLKFFVLRAAHRVPRTGWGIVQGGEKHLRRGNGGRWRVLSRLGAPHRSRCCPLFGWSM